jgi:hypothetical protein
MISGTAGNKPLETAIFPLVLLTLTMESNRLKMIWEWQHVKVAEKSGRSI